jgi:hypothetical protein
VERSRRDRMIARRRRENKRDRRRVGVAGTVKWMSAMRDTEPGSRILKESTTTTTTDKSLISVGLGKQEVCL